MGVTRMALPSHAMATLVPGVRPARARRAAGMVTWPLALMRMMRACDCSEFARMPGDLAQGRYDYAFRVAIRLRWATLEAYREGGCCSSGATASMRRTWRRGASGSMQGR